MLGEDHRIGRILPGHLADLTPATTDVTGLWVRAGGGAFAGTGRADHRRVHGDEKVHAVERKGRIGKGAQQVAQGENTWEGSGQVVFPLSKVSKRFELGPDQSLAQFYREISIDWLPRPVEVPEEAEPARVKRGGLFGRGRA